MRFVLVKTADDRFPGWYHWRATCPTIDYWFFLPAEWEMDDAKQIVRRKYPDASFSDEARQTCH